MINFTDEEEKEDDDDDGTDADRWCGIVLLTAAFGFFAAGALAAFVATALGARVEVFRRFAAGAAADAAPSNV